MLRQLPPISDPDLLVGLSTSDDAAVYRLRPDLALVQTIDFFPPIVDDPFSFGEIAVANALSDVYAMGGTPLLGLNVVAFPADHPPEVLAEILRGGASKAGEAGVLIVGGHTVDDREPKYGLAVTGTITPGRQITNAGARSGDVLVLTKPIGTGVITTAGKAGAVDESVLSGAVETMRALNAGASRAMVSSGANACSDVTGFGLVGHLREVVQASGLTGRIESGSVPLLAGARELAEAGYAPGGSRRNLESVDGSTAWSDAVDPTTRQLLADAQTSGGLLIAIAPADLEELAGSLEREGVAEWAAIGELVDHDEEGPWVIVE